MAAADAALSARRETSAFVGTWLFVLSDAIAFAALVSTMLGLGGGAASTEGMGSQLSGWVATLLLACSSLSLLLATRKESALAARLAWLCGVATALVQVLAFRRLLSQGFLGLEPAGERLVVIVLFHFLHLAVALALLGRPLLQGRSALGALSIYWQYMVAMWLVIFGLFYLL